MKLGKPDELIKARWIRPEDVGDYDEVGIDSLKLLERFRTTETMMQVVRAYEQRCFEGNLVELLTLPRRNAYNLPNLEYLIRPDVVNVDLMLEMADIFGYSFSDVMQINNRDLDGFAKHLKRMIAIIVRAKNAATANDGLRKWCELIKKGIRPFLRSLMLS